MPGKDGLTILNDRPVNAETPAHLLNDEVTPTSRHFVRNNGIPPDDMDAESWRLTIDGLVDKPMTLSIADLSKKDFEVVTQQLTIECGGNGRAFFEPPAKGNQWTYGAVASSEWTGVRLADVLKAAGVKPSAIYTAHEGADTHLSGDPDKLPISRGVPIEKAMNPSNLIAFAQNGADINPDERRAPASRGSRLARLLFPEVAHAGLAARQGARRRQDDRKRLPGAALSCRAGHQGSPRRTS